MPGKESGTILMRIKSSTGESCYFKDDTGRFSSDIDKNFTLKLKVQTAYKLTFECPKNLRVISLSIDGCPVPIEDVPGQRPDSDKVLVMGIWRTDTHFATDVSKREKLELVFVAQVDGCSGPESDERHLLKKKLLAKFYSPDYHKYTEKGHALGAIRFRCTVSEKGGSKVTSVHFADALHVEKLRKDDEEEQFVTTTHGEKKNTKQITIMKKGDTYDEDEAGEGKRGDGGGGESLQELLGTPTNSIAPADSGKNSFQAMAAQKSSSP